MSVGEVALFALLVVAAVAAVALVAAPLTGVVPVSAVVGLAEGSFQWSFVEEALGDPV